MNITTAKVENKVREVNVFRTQDKHVLGKRAIKAGGISGRNSKLGSMLDMTPYYYLENSKMGGSNPD